MPFPRKPDDFDNLLYDAAPAFVVFVLAVIGFVVFG